MKDTVGSGAVRAFEPRQDRDGTWHCRGHTRHNGAMRQCGARLERTFRFCGKCGGLIAWGGAAVFNGTVLRHLERMELP